MVDTENDKIGKGHDERSRIGLCADCRFMRRISSDRGSIFYLCELSATDATFPKYPRLPVFECRGYQREGSDSTS